MAIEVFVRFEHAVLSKNLIFVSLFTLTLTQDASMRKYIGALILPVFLAFPVVMAFRSCKLSGRSICSGLVVLDFLRSFWSLQ